MNKIKKEREKDFYFMLAKPKCKHMTVFFQKDGFF